MFFCVFFLVQTLQYISYTSRFEFVQESVSGSIYAMEKGRERERVTYLHAVV